MNNSDILNKVKQLTESDCSETSSAAKKALLLVEKVQNNEMTKAEFDDIIDDLTSLEHINDNMKEMDLYRQVITAYQAILQLKTMMSLF